MLERTSADSRRTTPAGPQAVVRPTPIRPQAAAGPASSAVPPRAATVVAVSGPAEATAPRLEVRQVGTSARSASAGSEADASGAMRTRGTDSKGNHSADKGISLDADGLVDPARRQYLALLGHDGRTLARHVVLLGLNEMRTLSTMRLSNPDGLQPSSLAVARLTTGVALLLISRDFMHMTLWHSDGAPEDLVESALACRRALERRSGQICAAYVFTHHQARRRLLQANQLADEEGGEFHFVENFSEAQSARNFVERAMARREKAIEQFARRLDCDYTRTTVTDLPWGIAVVEQGRGVHPCGDTRQPPRFKIDSGPRS